MRMIKTLALTERRAQELYEKLEADPSNPKWSEVHMRAGRVLKEGEHRITPRLAYNTQEEGTVILDLPDEDWIVEKLIEEPDRKTTLFSVDEDGDSWIELRGKPPKEPRQPRGKPDAILKGVGPVDFIDTEGESIEDPEDKEHPGKGVGLTKTPKNTRKP